MLNPDAPKTIKEDKHKTIEQLLWGKHVAQEYQVVSFCYNVIAVLFGCFKVQTNLS